MTTKNEQFDDLRGRISELVRHATSPARPSHSCPYMAERDFRVSRELTNTNIVMSHTFWLGTFQGMDEAQQESVAGKIETLLGINS